MIYFFVIQAIFIGLLTGNIFFYQLGAINAGAILVICIAYALFTGEKKEMKKEPKPEHKHIEPSPGGISSTEQPTSPRKSEDHEVVGGLIPPKVEKPLEEKKDNLQKIVQPLPPIPKKRKKS